MYNVWKTWEEFNQVIKNKRVVFFGVADDWFEKTFRRSDVNLAYIVDNNPTRKNKKYNVNEKYGDIEVKDPAILKDKLDDTYIVITSGAYISIIPQLLSYGLKAGDDFCCTPAMNSLKVIIDFDECPTKLLVCSSEHQIYAEIDKDKNIGGGLYLYEVNKRSYKKLMDGNFHQIIDASDKYYILDEKRGCLVVSKELEIINEFGFEMDSFSHGLTYCPIREKIFISKAGLDKISVYNTRDFSHLEDIVLSSKTAKYKRDNHHMNDIFVKDDFLYVSLFSHSGNWPKGIYDGGIIEINLDNYSDRHILINDAWMPHGVCFIDNELHYLDSMSGRLYRGSKKLLGEFSGFVRGLAYDSNFYYIGQSEGRYFDRLQGIKNYISLSGGVYMFDPQTKAGRFLSMQGVRQIRNVMVLSNENFNIINNKFELE